MTSLKTQLFVYHEKNGHLFDFANFRMPLWYEGTVPECLAVRNKVGIFDISHMGRTFVQGPDAERFLNYLTTNNVAAVKPNHAQYTLICNSDGGIKDDLVIFKFDVQHYLVVLNAGNREKDFTWFKENSSSYNIELKDVSNEVAMISIQGPKAARTIEKLTDSNLANMIRFDCTYTTIGGQECILSRTGYTGEDGLEICVLDASINNPSRALNLWHDILQAGKEFGIEPCGLGSRDVLRLEAGMCLYGNDITETTDPLEASLDFVVKFEKGDFLGKEAILRKKSAGFIRKRIGLRIDGKGIPRADCKILKGDKVLGIVSSGTYSPTINRGIAMGYVPLEYSKIGEKVSIEVHGKSLEAEIVGFPFYDPKLYGLKRGS
jgi:aminomethyltransferase